MKTALLKAIGTLAKCFPQAIDDPDHLKQKMLNELQKEISKFRRESQIVGGCLNGLSNYMESFPMDPNDKAAEIIYQAIKTLAYPPAANRRTTHRGKFYNICTSEYIL